MLPSLTFLVTVINWVATVEKKSYIYIFEIVVQLYSSGV